MGFSSKKKPNHITDRAADALEKATDSNPSHDDPVPGPSSNPSTNLIIHDILLRSVGRLSRLTVEKMVLGRQYGSQFAKDAVENRSVVHTLAAYGVTKVATKSVPGAIAVSSALALKVLFDRSQSRRKARRSGQKVLRKQAKEDSAV